MEYDIIVPTIGNDRVKQIRIYLEVLDNEIKEYFNCC